MHIRVATSRCRSTELGKSKAQRGSIQLMSRRLYRVPAGSSPSTVHRVVVHNWSIPCLGDLVLVVVVDGVVPAISRSVSSLVKEIPWPNALQGSISSMLQQGKLTKGSRRMSVVCLAIQHEAVNSPCHRHPTGSSWSECSGRGTQCAPLAEACGPSAPSEPSKATRRWRRRGSARG